MGDDTTPTPSAAAEAARLELQRALIKAQAKAKAVEKASVNDHHHYAYASCEDMIQEAREVLAEFELAFYAVGHRLIDGADHRVDCVIEYELAHSAGAVKHFDSVTPAVEDKGRPMDKATSTAKTYDLAYSLRSLLLLRRVEAGMQPDQRDDSNYVPARDRGREPPPKKQPPPAKQQPEKKPDAKPPATKKPAKEGAPDPELVELAAKMKALSEKLGKDVAAELTKEVDRTTIAGRRTIVRLLEEESIKRFGVPRTVDGFWVLAREADLTEDDARADLLERYGSREPSNLKPEQLVEACERLEKLAASINPPG